MNENPKDPNIIAIRLLTEIASMAEHASLTGGLRGGERQAVLTYNGALERLRMAGHVPNGMFEALDPGEANYGVLAVQARLLLSIVSDTTEEPRRQKDKRRREEGDGLGAVIALAPFLSSDDLAAMIRERMDEHTEVSDGLLTALAPFLDSRELGQLVRKRMRPSAPPAPPTPPSAPEPAPEPPVDYSPVVHEAPPDSLESLAERLRYPDLSVEERQQIAIRLAELAHEQSIRALE